MLKGDLEENDLMDMSKPPLQEMSPDTFKFEAGLQEVKESLASLFLTTLDFGKYILVMRSEYDLIIRGEPYMAYMLWLNVQTGQIISRTWNQTVSSGYVNKLYQLVHACQEHFMSGKPCLGLTDCGETCTDQEYVISQTPVPRRFSKNCHKTIPEPSGIVAHSCSECLKLDVNNVKSNASDEIDRRISVATDHEIINEDHGLSDLYNNKNYENHILGNTESYSKTIANLNTNMKLSTHEDKRVLGTHGKKRKIVVLTLNKAGKSAIRQKLQVVPTGQKVLKAKPKGEIEGITVNAQNSSDSINIPTFDEYTEHRRRTVPSASNQCCVCTMTFEDLGPKMDHMRRVHYWGFFRCPVCSKKKNFAKDLIEHMIEEEHACDLKCPKCKANFGMMDYQAHYEECVKPRQEKNKEECKICETCGKAVPWKNFKSHVKKNHTNSGKSYSHCCDRCGKRYNNSSHLTHHIKSAHDGIKVPVICTVCPICHETFKSRTAMNCHRNIEHDKKYGCNECGKYFGNNSRLETHRNIKHDHKYQCNQCGKIFGSFHNLEEHAKWHLEPQFPCTYCDKMFKMDKSLEAHERLHTGGKPYPCLMCEAKFASASGLSQHMRGVHKIAPRGGRTDWYRRERNE